MAKYFSMRCPFHVFMYSIAVASVASIAAVQYIHYNHKKRSKIPSELDNTTKYDKEMKAAIEIGIVAGQNLLDALDLPKSVEQKGNVDFVTATDKHNEKIIFEFLKQRFPEHEFIGEESASESTEVPVLSARPTWIVDPIDGTTNFMHTFPLTCVSIGLCVDSIPVVGVVVAPALGEVYVAVRGHGAYLNSKRIKTSGTRSIKDSIVLTELGYLREEHQKRTFLDCILAIVNKGPHALRMMGSGVLALCYVAAGRLDVLYTGVAGEGWKPWDYCAGSLLVEEAGGSVRTLSGDSFSVMQDTCIAAATLELCLEVRECVQQQLARSTSLTL